MKKLLGMLLLLAVPASAQIMGARNRKVFSSGGGIAIAFDNASTTATTTSTSLTYSFTVGSGANRMLFVGANVESTGTVTATYAGVAMTMVDSTAYNFGTTKSYMFALPSPASGANNVVITVSVSSIIASAASAYTGALQSTTMDNSTSTNAAGTGTTLTLTTVANNCWTVAFTAVKGTGASIISAGAGSTLRSSAGNTFAGLFDSNGPKTPPGSTSMVVNIGGSTVPQGSVMVSFTHA